MFAHQRRRDADRTRAVGLMADGAVLGVKRGTIGRRHRRRRDGRQAGAEDADVHHRPHATPTMTDTVQWYIELVLDMHQLISLCAPMR
jgi:hypothetical protein